MIVVASFLVAGLFPIAAVAVSLAGLRLWRLLLTLCVICVSVFGVLFAAVAVLDLQREPNPASAEPALSLLETVLCAVVTGIIVCDVVAVVGVPILFLAGGRRFRGPVAAEASTSQEEDADGP